MNYFLSLSPVMQAFIATLFTFLLTTLGASIVFCFKKINKLVIKSLIAISAGIMLAASYFSLLAPAVETGSLLLVVLGFISGGLLLYISDKIFTKILKTKSTNKRNLLLMSSITIHNIPEGLSIGVAFASAALGLEGVTVLAALGIALGIGIQNIPEGSAVALPLRSNGLSRAKAFILGALSGIVEPIAGVLGVLLILKVQFIMPFLLAFAAGAMIYVIVEELIPDSQDTNRKGLITILTILGFCIMMMLDVALG